METAGEKVTATKSWKRMEMVTATKSGQSDPADGDAHVSGRLPAAV
jgi:hypothetical protein